MSDIDLLLEPEHLDGARRVLQAAGYVAADSTGSPRAPHHEPQLTRHQEGVAISIELHHRLTLSAADSATAPAAGKPLDFAVGDARIPASAPDGNTMLWHLCQHLRSHMSVFGRHRLIWLADIVALTGRYHHLIDWPAMRDRHADAINLLSVLQAVTPLSVQVQQLSGIAGSEASAGDRPPADAGIDFLGWPSSALSDQRRKGWATALRDTFLPSEWWLRAEHGLGAYEPLWRHRWIVHPCKILALAADCLGGRLATACRPARPSKG